MMSIQKNMVQPSNHRCSVIVPVAPSPTAPARKAESVIAGDNKANVAVVQCLIMKHEIPIL